MGEGMERRVGLCGLDPIAGETKPNFVAHPIVHDSPAVDVVGCSWTERLFEGRLHTATFKK
jgi:hypothetical protein